MRIGTRKAAEEIVERYPVGSDVEVRYNPANPAQSTIETDRPGIWKIVFGVIFLLLAAFLMLVAWAMFQGW
jgi:hypothetical protein